MFFGTATCLLTFHTCSLFLRHNRIDLGCLPDLPSLAFAFYSDSSSAGIAKGVEELTISNSDTYVAACVVDRPDLSPHNTLVCAWLDLRKVASGELHNADWVVVLGDRDAVRGSKIRKWQ